MSNIIKSGPNMSVGKKVHEQSLSKVARVLSSRFVAFCPHLPRCYKPSRPHALCSLSNMRFFAIAALALPIAVTNAISIVGPNENAYWVQNATNTITWQFSEGDPSPISINVINANNATLNGEFAIASFVNVSDQTFAVTNVTLRPGDGYQVQFVNNTNITQVFAASPTFTVKPPGTSPAPTVSASSSAASGSATSPSGSTSTASPTGSAAGGDNGALSLTNGQGIFGAIIACGLVSVSGLLL
ncbi:hypothetical protein C8Q80DRAFT_943166 [Daedaleopsis nitida]|nr:hypothetical protein C8Q80DRAFT_943166 [Daedaleopsis nitida]